MRDMSRIWFGRVESHQLFCLFFKPTEQRVSNAGIFSLWFCNLLIWQTNFLEDQFNQWTKMRNNCLHTWMILFNNESETPTYRCNINQKWAEMGENRPIGREKRVDVFCLIGFHCIIFFSLYCSECLNLMYLFLFQFVFAFIFVNASWLLLLCVFGLHCISFPFVSSMLVHIKYIFSF